MTRYITGEINHGMGWAMRCFTRRSAAVPAQPLRVSGLRPAAAIAVRVA